VTADQFEQAQAALKKRNIAFAPAEDTGLAYSIFVYDPDCNKVELTTYHSASTDTQRRD